MAKTKCAYGKRGNSSIEWYTVDDKPQRYCYGWADAMLGETLEVCVNCPDYVLNAQKDLDEYRAKVEAWIGRTIKRGEWIENKEGFLCCSECGYTRIEISLCHIMNLCPNCGARMDDD